MGVDRFTPVGGGGFPLFTRWINDTIRQITADRTFLNLPSQIGLLCQVLQRQKLIVMLDCPTWFHFRKEGSSKPGRL